MQLPTKGIVGAEFEHGAVAFFNFQSGLTLALGARKSLDEDARLELQASSSTDFALAHNVGLIEEVDLNRPRIRGGCLVQSGSTQSDSTAGTLQ